MSAWTVSRSEVERRRADALRQEESAQRELERLRLRAVLDALPVGVFICEPDGAIREINPAAHAIWGASAPRVKSVQEYEVYKVYRSGTAQPLAAADRGMVKTLATGLPCLDQELDIETFEGARRTILSSTVPIRGPDRRLVGGVAVNVDITDRKHMERELRRLTLELETRVRQRTAELEAANHELEAYSYSVSHDLRAPLRWISGYSNALLEDFAEHLPPDARQLLLEVVDSAKRMGQLIDDLLRLSRVTRQEMHLEEVDLSELARGVAAEVQAGTPGQPVELVIAEGLRVPGDRSLLRIVLSNLLRNAWKFTRPQVRQRIEVGGQSLPGEQVIFVRDNGAGFDMSYADKLFQPFERLHSAAEFEGTGIGLAIVWRIVQRHGGRVWAEGAPGQGATFFVALPVPDPVPGEN